MAGKTHPQRKPQRLDVRPKVKGPPLYIGDLIERALKYIEDTRREQFCRGPKPSNGLTIQRLTDRSGLSWHLIYSYLHRRRRVTLRSIDKLMYAADITVLDLLLTPEVAAVYASTNPGFRNRVLEAAKKILADETQNSLDTPDETA